MLSYSRRAPQITQQSSGLSLVELVTALSIVAILGTIAVPNLANLHRSAARTAVVNDFMHSVFLARSRAITVNGVVSICRSANGVTCSNRTTQWETGWIVFENADRDQPADLDIGEQIIQRHVGWSGGHISSNRESFSFRPTSQGDVNGTITFCDRQGSSADARAIIISHTGRPRVSRRDANNRPLRCL